MATLSQGMPETAGWWIRMQIHRPGSPSVALCFWSSEVQPCEELKQRWKMLWFAQVELTLDCHMQSRWIWIWCTAAVRLESLCVRVHSSDVCVSGGTSCFSAGDSGSMPSVCVRLGECARAGSRNNNRISWITEIHPSYRRTPKRSRKKTQHTILHDD